MPGTGRAPSAIPADPWPRVVDLTGAQVLVYQPQINEWTDNQLDFRAAMALKKDRSKDQDFGVLFATTRTQVDQRPAHRRVREPADLEDRLPDAARSRRQLSPPSSRRSSRRKVRTISLDKLQASLAANGVKPAARGGQQRAAARHRQQLAGDPGSDRRRAGDEAGARQRALPARHQYARADPAGRARAEASTSTSTTAGFRRASLDGPVDAVVPPAARRWTTSRRNLAKNNTVDLLTGGPNANPEAVARQRRADDLHEPGAGRAHRVQGPTRFRAHRRHAAAVGIEHDERRADRHHQQQLLRAARGPLVPRRRR